MGWARSLALLIVATLAVGQDGWTTSAAGCWDYLAITSPLQTAPRCAELSRRRHSMDAAVRAALLYIDREQPERALEVLSPFETTGDPRVLYNLGWSNSRLNKRELALKQLRQAYVASANVKDVRVRANAANLLSHELTAANEFEEAARVLDGLLRDSAEPLGLEFERDARLNLARTLLRMGDGPAAEAELGRLRSILAGAPMSSLELMLDANIHTRDGELKSADGLLEQARRAAQREDDRAYEAVIALEQLKSAAKQGDWSRVHTLAAETEALKDVLPPDAASEQAFVGGVTARAQGRLEESRRLFEQALSLSPPPNLLWEMECELGVTLKTLGLKDDARQALERSIADVELQRKLLVEPSRLAALKSSREKPYDTLLDIFAESNNGDAALSTLQRSLASRLGDEVAVAASSVGEETGDAVARSAARRQLAQASSALPAREASAWPEEVHFVAFVATDSHSWALVHAGGKTNVEEVALPPKEFCALMARFGEALDDENATRLGSALFPPVRLKQLGTRFAIVLPTCARNVPLAAVRVGGERLVDRAVVSIAPDLSTMTWPGKALSGSGGRRHLVLADPLGDLPSAREEAQWAGRATGAEVWLGQHATTAALPSSSEMLHFATHTRVDASGPSLVLADGTLSVGDILGRRLHADLVLLASCHSGTRLAASAAETLSTAFLRSGSGAVLATFRSVEDEFASRVVRAFYARGGLEDPAGALAGVQRELSRTEPPARWSAFFIAGTPQQLNARPSAGLRAQAVGG